MSGVQTLTVGQDEAEQRLDRWFRRQFPHIPQGRIEKMCRKGEIRVEGGRVKTSTRIGPGQQVRIPPLPEPGDMVPREEMPAQDEPFVSPEQAARLQAAVVFRDDHMIVLNKPAGLAVQGGSKIRDHLVAQLSALSFGREDEPRLIHRLDKDTSGLLVLARTGAMAVSLAALFRSRAVEKIYYAAVAGRPDPMAGTIRYGLVKAGRAGEGEKMRLIHPDEVKTTEGAKHATTDYRVIESAGGRASWVALRPVTGRTHQLRAHMAALGTPIAGDGKYGGRAQENLGDGWGAGMGGAISRKLHLHAARLSFPHPATGKPVAFQAPLPDHMARTWEMFGWSLADVPEPIFEE
ncbi:RluA family pseudouridine synthase [Rhodobacteraceae bacterium NNCM2]|nr:RluA family pseudouridine synthase [Coraliihabitans acroporae]